MEGQMSTLEALTRLLMRRLLAERDLARWIQAYDLQDWNTVVQAEADSQRGWRHVARQMTGDGQPLWDQIPVKPVPISTLQAVWCPIRGCSTSESTDHILECRPLLANMPHGQRLKASTVHFGW